MEREWTGEQRLAIETRDRTLLVSAAAGAGKTATLTERIIRSLLDEDCPADIGSMLIVTFTNAAVGELRDRISAAVCAAAEKNPDNERLKRQLLTVKDAKIMTISSFCNEIVRNRAAALGIPESYRIADEIEAELILNDTVDGLLEAAFEGELFTDVSAEDFAALSDSLVGNKNDIALGEVFKEIYKKTDGFADRAAKLDPLVERLADGAENPSESFFVKYCLGELRCVAEGLYTLLDGVLSRGTFTDGELKYLDIFHTERAHLLALSRAADYASARETLLSFEFGRRIAPRERGADYEQLVAIRDIYKTKITKIKNELFTYSLEEMANLHTNLYKLVGIFVKFLKKLDEVYTEEKINRAALTYADLSRYAYLALYEGGEPSALALSLRDSFSFVYVDEYQDVNELDNKIFEAVSRPDNRFMVGDIKQSIYGFRLASPEIFEKMKTSFPKLGEEGDYPFASSFMSKNFRCDEPIIDFINSIFDKAFPLVGGVGYEWGDSLGFAKKYKENERPTGHIPEIHLVSAPDTSGMSPEDAIEAEVIGARRAEALAVASKVRELTGGEYRLASGRAIRPSDIAIIMRSTKGAGEEYARALEEVGIASSLVGDGDFFFTKEILLVLSLLNSIDNPRRDIYLAALMNSALYSISPDTLLKIRRESSAETLWEALSEYAPRHPEDGRTARFLSDIKRYRALSEGMSVDRLIAMLYRETGIFALLSAKGQRENLLLLHTYARNFEKSSFGGLYSFISYVNTVIEGGGRLDREEDGGNLDAVTIMTVHKSKGLEFPVVIYAGAEAPLTRTENSPVRFAEDFGLAVRERDTSGLVMVENPIFTAISGYNKKREYEEELRIIYVALTRAREMLYVYAAPRAKIDKVISSAELSASLLSPYIARSFSSVIELILATSRRVPRVNEYLDGDAPRPAEPCAEEGIGQGAQREARQTDGARDGTEPIPSAEKPTVPSEELVSRFNYIYPREYLTRLPKKLSVSKLSPAVLDGTEDSGTPLEDEPAPRGIIPKFVSGKPADESRLRGIATHTLLQFADFEALRDVGVARELERLVEREFITREDASRVRISEIETFVRGELFSKILSARNIWREFRFNLTLPASLFTENEELRESVRSEELLVQGVIDCLIENEKGELVLIDYKTDRLTKEELKAPELGAARLIEKHKTQLLYYSLAVRKMFGKRPTRVLIYSLHLGREIEVR